MTSQHAFFAAVDEGDIVSCVSCGLCLPHCPTYRISGDDAQSPRGRIALVASVRSGALELNDDVTAALEGCVQCMGCLPACPSGVRYDRIIEPVVAELAARRPWSMLGKRLLLAPIGRQRVLEGLTTIAAIAQRLRAVPRRFSLPRLSLRRRRILTGRFAHSSFDPVDVTLFTGCVMSAWYSDVHQATVDVLERLGCRVTLTNPSMCCGALHRHAGLMRRAERFENACASIGPGTTLIVNSAGCGANLMATSTNATDVMAYLATRLDDVLSITERSSEAVVIHDPCHLRNVQRSHLATHAVLSSLYETETIPDEGLCCGAGGAYAITYPEAASKIVDRKIVALRSTNGTWIASGNPGCSAHMEAHLPDDFADRHVVHPIQLVARRLVNTTGSSDSHG